MVFDTKNKTFLYSASQSKKGLRQQEYQTGDEHVSSLGTILEIALYVLIETESPS